MVHDGISYTSTPVSEHQEFDTPKDEKKAYFDKFRAASGGDVRRKTKLSTLMNRSIRRRNLVKRIAYVIVGVAIMTIWIGVMVAFANQQQKYAKEIANSDLTTHRKVGSISGAAVFQGTLRRFDLDARSLTIQWAGQTVASTGNDLIPMGKADNNESVIAEIAVYQDNAAVRDTVLEDYFNKTLITFDDGTAPPFYALANRTAKRVGTIGLNEWDSFDTDIDLGETDTGSVWHQPLFGYPFDLWTGSIVLATNLPSFASSANDIYLNETLSGTFPNDTTAPPPNNFAGSFIFSFESVSLIDAIQNWKVEATSENTCDKANATSCELHITINAKRPGIVIFCVMVVVIINWLSTIAIFLLTCESVFLRRPHILTEIDILGVCFSALFALPSVRSLLPGAPDFAAIIDLIGILPNVIVISVCTTIVAFDRIVHRKED